MPLLLIYGLTRGMCKVAPAWAAALGRVCESGA